MTGTSRLLERGESFLVCSLHGSISLRYAISLICSVSGATSKLLGSPFLWCICVKQKSGTLSKEKKKELNDQPKLEMRVGFECRSNCKIDGI